ncbi:MAG: dTDP-4-dehydrorhamnose reductase [Pigmentiphaga sp.]|uniref:dTDP-4-dehydrorhamnose reductase n=1 Tax=Pigmentiphaga sp. TaxID=1977564 RepID=UPI0029BF3D49|nr:dTDP-4-dehydrorhamnose reductase [Pigmentiphaga sp.]MDX3906787.1 dTDP-4-dehydrorhamnose reductase [Pigmentiphaga sp.]
MTILVTGAGGQVGRELILRASQPVVGMDRSQLDITDPDAVERAITRHGARLVINAAAYTAVDRAESEVAQANAVNRDGVRTLAQACRNAGIPMFHLSTDYVFDGNQPAPYAESDTPHPTGVYGQSKLDGEEELRQRLDQHLILRVSWVFGAYGNNFVRTMLRLGRERPELRVVADQRGGPTHAGAIADALLDLARRHAAGESLPWGTYHYSGTPVVTWHAFAQAIFAEAHAQDLLDRIPAVHAITTADYPTPARRPANSALDNSLAHSRLGLASPDWRTGLREVLTTWKHEA